MDKRDMDTVAKHAMKKDRAKFLKMKQAPVDGDLGFAKREPLFTPAERSFLGALEQALDGSYRVFGKVRLGDIVRPAKGLSNSKRATAHNKINQKHVDFVVCSVSDLAVVGAVELDDKSHERDDRSSRDQFVDRALADAKIPVIHFSAKKGYALAEIKAKLATEHFGSLAKIHVDTDKNGVVWMSGTVNNQAELDQAMTIARNTEGVKTVKSSLKIRSHCIHPLKK